MATQSNVLAWRIPGTGEPGGLCLWGCTESDTESALLLKTPVPLSWFRCACGVMGMCILINIDPYHQHLPYSHSSRITWKRHVECCLCCLNSSFCTLSFQEALVVSIRTMGLAQQWLEPISHCLEVV